MEEKNQEHGRALYEISYHILPTVSEEDLEKEVARIRLSIERRGGSIHSEEFPKQFSLTYPLVRSQGGKNTRFETSYFGHIVFNAEPLESGTFERELMSESAILRASLIRTTKETTMPKRPRSVLAPSHEKESRSDDAHTTPTLSNEALDEEIEKLVVE